MDDVENNVVVEDNDIVKKYAALFKLLSLEFSKTENKVKGYTKEDLARILKEPERFQLQLSDLSLFMYRRSGLYKRIVDHFADMALCRWSVDTEVLSERFFKVKKADLSKNFAAFAGFVSRLGLEKEFRDIFIRVFLEDACFGYFVDTDFESFIYYFPSRWCSIRKSVNGIDIFGINPSLVGSDEAFVMPQEIRDLLSQKTSGSDPYVYPAPDKCFCVKFNKHFNYLFPPMFDLLDDVVDVEDFKDLGKAQAESENYNLLGLTIPTGKDNTDDVLLSADVVTPVARMARAILPKSFGVVPSPMPMEALQWKSSVTASRDRVRESVSNFYDEAGVAKGLFGEAGSGSQLKMSIETDASVVYRLYRQIERIVNFKAALSGFLFPSYKFAFRLLDVTHYNVDEKAAVELKMCQASLPHKLRLAAAIGSNPSVLLGNGHMENVVLGGGKGLGHDWTVLKSSYTQASSDGGRPPNAEKGEGVTEVTEAGDDNEGNDPDNRV